MSFERQEEMKAVLYNVVGEPVRTKHLGWYVAHDPATSELLLKEVVEAVYPHPEYPDETYVERMESHKVLRCKEGSPEAAPLMLLMNAQSNIDLLRDALDF